MNARDLPETLPMMARLFRPIGRLQFFGGVLVMDDYEVENVGLVGERLPFDTDVVDCSNRIFQITTWMMFMSSPMVLTVFPSRRWRNMREAEDITDCPDQENPLLYLGNPIRLLLEEDGAIQVVSSSKEFKIRNGLELGY